MAIKVRGLTPKQEQAIAALLGEPTVKQAAETCGVALRTLHRWLDDADFWRAYASARRRVFNHAISLTQHYAPLAVQTLAKVMADPSAPHSARVSAAGLLLKFSREAIELDDLAMRVDALERAAAEAPAPAAPEGRRLCA